ncbi:hypothetical protein QBC44DRAFT_31601 [Cladorrhinum sp. PSN332]|nr:hypothetical protein QBC44DRAFT_31601 [Cladorrhinum sp. PSN332]
MHLMGLLSSTTGLAFVNEASHRLDDHGGGGDDIGCNVFDVTCIDSSQGDGPHQGDAGTTKCAGLYFDYFKECTDDFPEVSEFIKSPEDQRCSESISWTEMELCPRRFSIALWHSSLPPNDSDQKSPLVTLLFMDSSSHADSWLPHPPLRIGRTLDKTMIDLAYNIVEGYMEFVSTRLGRTWSEVSWRANRHVRHLTRSTAAPTMIPCLMTSGGPPRPG